MGASALGDPQRGRKASYPQMAQMTQMTQVYRLQGQSGSTDFTGYTDSVDLRGKIYPQMAQIQRHPPITPITQIPRRDRTSAAAQLTPSAGSPKKVPNPTLPSVPSASSALSADNSPCPHLWLLPSAPSAPSADKSSPSPSVDLFFPESVLPPQSAVVPICVICAICG